MVSFVCTYKNLFTIFIDYYTNDGHLLKRGTDVHTCKNVWLAAELQCTFNREEAHQLLY